MLFGEYGSGKTQVLIEKVRQTAWEMHFKKIKSIIYLFSFADVEVKYIFYELIFLCVTIGKWKVESERVSSVALPDVYQQAVQRGGEPGGWPGQALQQRATAPGDPREGDLFQHSSSNYSVLCVASQLY